MPGLGGPVLYTAVFLSVLYWLFAAFANNRILIVFMDGPLISSSLFVAMIYGKRWRKACCVKNPKPYDIILFGIAILAGFNAIIHAIRGWARVTGQGWLLDHTIVGYSLLGMAFGAMLHLAVKGAATEPHRAVGVSAIAAITVATLLGIAISIFFVAVDLGIIRR
jgi:hypothetical protein